MYQNYIFDLYGTLVDIHTNERKAYLWKKTASVFAMLGAEYTPAELRKQYRRYVAQEQEWLLAKKRREKKDSSISISEVEIQLENVFAGLLADRQIEVSKERLWDIAIFFRAVSLERLALFDGAGELLEILHQRGKRVYLLSNAQRIFTEPEMKQLQIYDCFDGILYSSDVGFQKPSSYFYQALFEKYSLKKEESVMIGNDRFADVEGAFRFGIDSMYVHTEQSTPFSGEFPKNCRVIQNIREAGKISHKKCRPEG